MRDKLAILLCTVICLFKAIQLVRSVSASSRGGKADELCNTIRSKGRQGFSLTIAGSAGGILASILHKIHEQEKSMENVD
jgi:hypothetical protein